MSKEKNYVITSTFWSLFNSFLRGSSEESATKSRAACIWLTGELNILSSVLLGVEPTLVGIVHDHWITNHEAPSLAILEDWLESNPNPELEDALSEYREIQDSLRQHEVEDLGALLNRKNEEAKRYRLDKLINDVKVINSVGAEIKRGRTKETLKGPEDAIKYFIQKLDSGSVVSNGDVKTHGTVQESTEYLKEAYEDNKHQSGNRKRIRCGLNQIDEMVSFKKGHLVGVLGFAGQRKTSFCRSWAYNAALEGHNTLHVSLEQQFSEELYYYGILHAHNPKWGGRFNITTKAFEDGLLTKAEEDFFFNEVMPDFRDNVPGKIIIRQPTDGMTWEAIETIADITDRITPIDMLLMDYLTLADVSGGYGSEKERQEQNIKRAKRFAMNFRNGEGLLLLTPVQGNREGYEHAAKNEGRWEMDGVYMYSEFDKSVDTMLYVFLDDDLQADGQIVMGSCKSRRSSVIKPYKNAINCSVGYVSNLRKHAKDDKIIDDVIEDL